MAALCQLPPVHDTIPRRRLLPRHGFPQKPPDLRTRLFRRSDRVWPRRPLRTRSIYVFPPESIIAAPLLLWAQAVSYGSSALAANAARSALLLLALVAISGYVVLPGVLGVRRSQSRHTRASPTRAIFPMRGASTERLALRRPADLFGSLHALRSRALGQRCLQPPRAPRQHLCRHVHRWRWPGGDHAPPPRRRGAHYFLYLPMYYPYVVKEKPNTFVVQFGGGISTNDGTRRRRAARSPSPSAIPP